MAPNNENITKSEAENWTANYRNTKSASASDGQYFSREAVENILNQTDCEGIRVYYAIDNTTSQDNLIIVGVDSNGNDMLVPDSNSYYKMYKAASHCPPYCGNSNFLNS